MNTTDLRAALPVPEVLKLKQLALGIRVGRVLHDFVLVEAVVPYTKADEVIKSGLLHLPEQAKKDATPLPNTGIVLDAGPEARQHIKDGEMVMFSKFAGIDATFSDDKDAKDQPRHYKLLRWSEIICTLVSTDEPLNCKVVPVVPDKA